MKSSSSLQTDLHYTNRCRPLQALFPPPGPPVFVPLLHAVPVLSLLASLKEAHWLSSLLRPSGQLA